MIDPEDEGQLAQDVGRRLRQVREILNVSQVEFAKTAGLLHARYHNYEAGYRLLTLRAAFLLCAKYNLTLDFLFLGDPSGLKWNMVEALKLKKTK